MKPSYANVLLKLAKDRTAFYAALDAEVEDTDFEQRIGPEWFYSRIAKRLGVTLNNEFRDRCRDALIQRHKVKMCVANGALYLRWPWELRSSKPLSEEHKARLRQIGTQRQLQKKNLKQTPT